MTGYTANRLLFLFFAFGMLLTYPVQAQDTDDGTDDVIIGEALINIVTIKPDYTLYISGELGDSFT
jgi:hypothetical protein